MVVALVMLIVGSNIARAFSLVGALSIIRFRNAVKESRDVGFIFLTMAIGMAVGTRFYLLAGIAAAVISLVILVMTRFNWLAREIASQPDPGIHRRAPEAQRQQQGHPDRRL